MLDVHPPHHPTHTWKDFFIHIATISVGLLIGLGLEQVAEWTHHRHQAEQIEEALRREGEANRDLNRQNMQSIQIYVEWLQGNIQDLQTAAANGGAVHRYQWKKLQQRIGWLPLSDTSWQLARDSAAFAQLPERLVRNRWREETTLQQVNQLGSDSFNRRYLLEAMLYRNGAEIELSPEQARDALTTAVELNAEMHHLYSSSNYYDVLNQLAAQDVVITPQKIMETRVPGSNTLPYASPAPAASK